MSQNRAPKDRQGVVSGLALRDRGDDQQIAELVLRHTKPSHADS
jgi:predicted FMN-binding regulatory protein PaiB